MQLKNLYFFERILLTWPKGILKVLFTANIKKKINLMQNFFEEEIFIIINVNFLKFYLNFFKNYTLLQCKILTDLVCVDFLNKKLRFFLVYNLLSLRFNFRLFLAVELEEFKIVTSIFDIYKSSIWLEREVWDLFGIFFSNHPDLRRILTDYGFNGFPLRKDFPLTGFLELRYDEEKKCIIYENLELSQGFRNFLFDSTFEQLLNKTYKKNKISF